MFTLQDLLQLALAGPGVGVGVGGGVAVGPAVGVGVGVGVGVAVGVGMANVNVQADSAALGVTWGTVGATGWVVVSFWLVKNTMTPRPAVNRRMKSMYQYFFIKFICLF